jgi:hypothetical protein
MCMYVIVSEKKREIQEVKERDIQTLTRRERERRLPKDKGE